MKTFLATLLLLWGASYALSCVQPANPIVADISSPWDGSTIRVRATARSAGAIDLVSWNGQQFVDSTDHGRMMQVAWTGHSTTPCINPTEAGSALDLYGQSTQSVLLSHTQPTSKTFSTSVLPAYWSPIGQITPCVAPYTSQPSDYPFAKTVSVGLGPLGLQNVIQIASTIITPRFVDNVGIEAITGYMPAEFSVHNDYNGTTDTLTPIPPDNNPNTQFALKSIIFSTTDANFAMGCKCTASAAYPGPSSPNPIYSSTSFPLSVPLGFGTQKWNSFFRYANLLTGTYTFNCYIPVGTFAQVRASLQTIFLGGL